MLNQWISISKFSDMSHLDFLTSWSFPASLLRDVMVTQDRSVPLLRPDLKILLSKRVIEIQNELSPTAHLQNHLEDGVGEWNWERHKRNNRGTTLHKSILYAFVSELFGEVEAYKLQHFPQDFWAACSSPALPTSWKPQPHSSKTPLKSTKAMTEKSSINFLNPEERYFSDSIFSFLLFSLLTFPCKTAL